MAEDKLKDSLEIEEQKYNYNLQIEEEKFIYNLNIESFKAWLESGKNAMKAPFLLNSGASIAMLTFITKLITDKETELMAKSLLISLKWYVIGVFCAAIAYGITYFTQLYNYKSIDSITGEAKIYDRKSMLIGHWTNIASIIFVIASFLLFAYASIYFYIIIQAY